MFMKVNAQESPRLETSQEILQSNLDASVSPSTYSSSPEAHLHRQGIYGEWCSRTYGEDKYPS